MKITFFESMDNLLSSRGLLQGKHTGLDIVGMCDFQHGFSQQFCGRVAEEFGKRLVDLENSALLSSDHDPDWGVLKDATKLFFLATDVLFGGNPRRDVVSHP